VKESNAPFQIPSGGPVFALGFIALWAILIAMVEAGAGDLAAALAVLIAGGLFAVAAPKLVANFTTKGA
jgi:hypothetical protein